MPYRNGQFVNWKAKVDIHQYLGEEETQEAMLDAAKGIRKEMERVGNKPFIPDTECDKLGVILEEMDDAAKEGDLEWFNQCVEGLYDWADINLVWLGG